MSAAESEQNFSVRGTLRCGHPYCETGGGALVARGATSNPSRMASLRSSTALRIAGMVALAGLVAFAALRSRSLVGSLHELGRPQLGWLAVALGAELAALAAYAAIVRRLLALGGVRAGIPQLLRPTVGGIALSATLPGGQAASGVLWYRQLRRVGADGQLAG